MVTPAQQLTFRTCPCDEGSEEGNNSAPTAEEWVEAHNEQVQLENVAVSHEAAEGRVEAVLPPALPKVQWWIRLRRTIRTRDCWKDPQ